MAWGLASIRIYAAQEGSPGERGPWLCLKIGHRKFHPLINHEYPIASPYLRQGGYFGIWKNTSIVSGCTGFALVTDVTVFLFHPAGWARSRSTSRNAWSMVFGRSSNRSHGSEWLGPRGFPWISSIYLGLSGQASPMVLWSYGLSSFFRFMFHSIPRHTHLMGIVIIHYSLTALLIN